MAGSLTRQELAIVNALRDAGVPENSAALAVVMITREHSRPRAELEDILRQYQHLESPADVAAAIDDLRRRGWLVERESYGMVLQQQAPDLKDQLARLLGKQDLPLQLAALRAVLDPHVRVVGQMNEQCVYSTYLDLLRRAQHEICLPMLATSPRLSSVPIIRERAERGVRIRVLLGSPAVVSRLRGETMRAMAEAAIAGWRAALAGSRTVEIRVAHRVDDMQLATCMLTDGRILRFDVYDPWHQRSLQGVMLEAESPEGLDLNLVALFKARFDLAWGRAEPLGKLAAIGWKLMKNWRWVAFTGFAVAAAVTRHRAVLLAIFGSAAASFLVDGLVSAWPATWAFLRRRRP